MCRDDWVGAIGTHKALGLAKDILAEGRADAAAARWIAEAEAALR